MEVMEGLIVHKVSSVQLHRKSGPWHRVVLFMSPKERVKKVVVVTK